MIAGPLDLAAWLIAWLGAVVLLMLVRRARQTPGSGLVYAYLLNLWSLHWLGAVLYLLPWARSRDFDLVLRGLMESVQGVFAFVFGSIVLAPVVLSLRSPTRQLPAMETPWRELPRWYLLVGAGSYLVASSLVGRIPTIGSVLVSGQQFVVVGLCLACWRAWREDRGGRVAALLGLSAMYPLVTIVGQGFMGYGVAAAAVVFMFAASFLRPRWKTATAYVLVAYLLMSFYVSYMRDRGEIREVVWGGRPLAERVEQLYETLARFEWFDPTDPAHLLHVDVRLNQNVFVGVAANRLGLGGEYAYGETFGDAVLALVPRAIWPDKPSFGGSGDLVRRYTGIRFAEGTSVGVGHVLELYINFGTTGVVVGLMLLGLAVTLLDAVATERLAANDWQGFALRYVPALALLQAGGALAEATGAAAASVVAVLLMNHLLGRWTVPVRVQRMSVELSARS
jgi:hypothetical protein